MHKKIIITAAVFISFIASAIAGASTTKPFYNAFYVGFAGGYGDTTWHELIDNDKNQTIVQLTTPNQVKEGGFAWGPFVGFDFSRYFAIEAHYTHYPKANIHFVKKNLYGIDEMDSHTDSFNAIAKVLAPVLHTPLRFYADAGVAATHRRDTLARTQWNFGPTFGAGFNYLINQHIMTEIGFQFSTGNGQSRYLPVDDYVPFVYAAQFRLAYRFTYPDYHLD